MGAQNAQIICAGNANTLTVEVDFKRNHTRGERKNSAAAGH
jgi:hypothetical protein